VFRDRVTAMSAGDEGLYVGVKRAVYHFGHSPGSSSVPDIRNVPPIY